MSDDQQYVKDALAYHESRVEHHQKVIAYLQESDAVIHTLSPSERRARAARYVELRDSNNHVGDGS